MQSSQQAVPRFGDWDDNKDLSYSVIFDRARADKERNLNTSIDSAAYYAYQNARELKGQSAAPHQNVFNSSEMASGKRMPHEYHAWGNTDFADSSFESQSVNSNFGGRVSINKDVNSPARSSQVSSSGRPRQMVAPNEASATGNYLQVGGHPSGLAYDGHQGRPSSKTASSERKFWENAGGMSPTPVKFARSQRSSESPRTVDGPDKTGVPRFGNWDASDASSGEGFTQMFERVRDEKKLKSSQKTSVQRVSPGRPDEDLYNPRLSQASASHSNVPVMPKKTKGWARFLCCMYSNGRVSKPTERSAV